jgi:hypothetical protein
VILANIRQQLTRGDAQLALRLVSRGSESAFASAEERLRRYGLDALLDDPRLPEALAECRQAAHASLPLFAYVVVRHALREVQEHDRGISDYVASILVHFAMRDNAHRIGGADDEVYDTMAALLAHVDHGDATRRFLVRAHMGNYALWLAGLFPDRLEERRSRRGGPDLDYYNVANRRWLMARLRVPARGEREAAGSIGGRFEAPPMAMHVSGDLLEVWEETTSSSNDLQEIVRFGRRADARRDGWCSDDCCYCCWSCQRRKS